MKMVEKDLLIEEANLESLNEGFQRRNDNQSSNELSPVNNDLEDIINNTLDMDDFIDDSNPQKNQNEVENNDSNPQQNNDFIIQTQYLNDFKNMNLIPNNFMHDKTNLIIINVFYYYYYSVFQGDKIYIVKTLQSNELKFFFFIQNLTIRTFESKPIESICKEEGIDICFNDKHL